MKYSAPLRFSYFLDKLLLTRNQTEQNQLPSKPPSPKECVLLLNLGSESSQALLFHFAAGYYTRVAGAAPKFPPSVSNSIEVCGVLFAITSLRSTSINSFQMDISKVVASLLNNCRLRIVFVTDFSLPSIPFHVVPIIRMTNFFLRYTLSVPNFHYGVALVANHGQVLERLTERRKCVMKLVDALGLSDERRLLFLVSPPLLQGMRTFSTLLSSKLSAFLQAVPYNQAASSNHLKATVGGLTFSSLQLHFAYHGHTWRLASKKNNTTYLTNHPTSSKHVYPRGMSRIGCQSPSKFNLASFEGFVRHIAAEQGYHLVPEDIQKFTLLKGHPHFKTTAPDEQLRSEGIAIEFYSRSVMEMVPPFDNSSLAYTKGAQIYHSGLSRRTVVMIPQKLSPLGLSLWMWLVAPAERNVGLVLTVLQQSRVPNCLADMFGNRHNETRMPIVIPAQWLHYLKVPNEFINKFVTFGKLVAVISG